MHPLPGGKDSPRADLLDDVGKLVGRKRALPGRMAGAVEVMEHHAMGSHGTYIG
jgi:hypothetical protein